MLDFNELMFFDQHPDLTWIYEVLKQNLMARYDDIRVKVSKSQISFYNRHMFAMASLPLRRQKEWPQEYLMVSFGLENKLENDRIAVAVEPYPNRWTHHVIVESPEEIDDELLVWLDEAYEFSNSKR